MENQRHLKFIRIILIWQVINAWFSNFKLKFKNQCNNIMKKLMNKEMELTIHPFALSKRKKYYSKTPNCYALFY